MFGAATLLREAIETIDDLANHAVIGFDRVIELRCAIAAVWPAMPSFTLRTHNHFAQVTAVRAVFAYRRAPGHHCQS